MSLSMKDQFCSNVEESYRKGCIAFNKCPSYRLCCLQNIKGTRTDLRNFFKKTKHFSVPYIFVYIHLQLRVYSIRHTRVFLISLTYEVSEFHYTVPGKRPVASSCYCLTDREPRLGFPAPMSLSHCVPLAQEIKFQNRKCRYNFCSMHIICTSS